LSSATNSALPKTPTLSYEWVLCFAALQLAHSQTQRARIVLDKWRQPRTGPAVVSREQFAQNWEALTGGILRGMDWHNVVVAGGAVLGTGSCV
jgi:hypothetical protein